MCTPIVIDTPNVDLSNDPTKADPAGTGTTTPGPVSPPPPPAASDGTTVAPPAGDSPATMAADGQTFTPPAGGETGTTPPAGTDLKAANFLLPVANAVIAGATAPEGTPKSGEPQTIPVTPDGGTGTPSDPVLDQNTLLINSLTELAHKFTDTTSSILQGQQDATNALNQGFLNLNDQQKKALEAADQLRKNTGQASRKPNYSLSLAANKKRNSSGQSSTMLTGPTGVPTNSLSLGRAQLLGGQPA